MSLNYKKSYNEEISSWLSKVFKYAKYLSNQKLIERSCPVCEEKSYSHFANNDYLNYVKCEKCSLVYINPAVDKSEINKGFKGDDDILMEYFNIIMKYKKDIPQKPDPEKDNKLCDVYRLKKTGKLLDVGCSVGDFLHKAKHFYEVEGIEVNPYTSEISSKYFTVHKDYLENLNCKKNMI